MTPAPPSPDLAPLPDDDADGLALYLAYREEARANVAANIARWLAAPHV